MRNYVSIAAFVIVVNMRIWVRAEVESSEARHTST